MSNSEIIGRIFSEAISCLHGGADGGGGRAPARGVGAVFAPGIWGYVDEGVVGGAGAPAGSDTKETDVAVRKKKKPGDDEAGIPDMPPEITEGSAGEGEDDLDTLLEELASSAEEAGDELSNSALDSLARGQEDDLADSDDDASPLYTIPEDDEDIFGDSSGVSGDDDEDGEDSGDVVGGTLDDLLEHALGLEDVPSDSDDDEDIFGDGSASVGDDTGGAEEEEEETLGGGFLEDDEEAEDGVAELGDGDFQDKNDDYSRLDDLIGAADRSGGGECLADEAGDSGDMAGDIGSGLGDLLNDDDIFGGGDEGDGEGEDVVHNIPVPEPSIPLTEDADEELERRLSEMGLGGDNLLHNRFSSGKEKLLNHLLARFEALARRKLEKLPSEQVSLVRSVNLRVEIDLKFGEFVTSGDDDSLFSLEI